MPNTNIQVAQTLGAAQGPGTFPVMAAGKQGDAVFSEYAGRYYLGSYNKSRYSGANQAAVTTSAAFATAYTGLMLYNPSGSGVNCILEKFGLAEVVAQTAALAFGIMTGINTGTAVSGVTADGQKSKFVGQNNGAGLIYKAATLPTAPTLDTVLGSLGTGAVTVDTVDGFIFDLGGDIILPPGAYACLYTSAASVASSLIASFQWMELPQ